MNDRTGGDRMICPKCGVEQAAAVECVNCGVVVARYHRPGTRWRPTPTTMTMGAVGALLLMSIGGFLIWWGLQPPPKPPIPPAPPPRAPDVVTNADPTALDAFWSSGAAGVRSASQQAMEQRLLLVVYFHNRECPACKPFQEQVLNTASFRQWLGDGLKADVNVDTSPEDKAMADKFGVTALPAFYVVRTNGQKVAVPMFKPGSTELLDLDSFVAACKKAQGN